MRRIYFQRNSELLAATLAGALALIVSLTASAQGTAQAPAPVAPPPVAPAPVAPPPAAPAVAPAPPPPVAPAPIAAPPPEIAAYPAAPPPTDAPNPSWGAPPPKPVSREQPTIFFGPEFGVAVGSLHDFISKASFRGFELGALWPVFRSLYLGPYFNHHLFYEEQGTTTYQLDSGALTGDIYRYARFWTMGGLARYHFLEADSIARPYLGLRMGMTFVTAATLVSDLSLYDDPLGFALSPELGVLVRVASILQISGSVRYDFSTASSGQLDNASFMAFQLGLAFRAKPRP